MRLWPFAGRRRRREVADARAHYTMQIQQIKVDVARQLASEDARTAAMILWGGAKGAQQTLAQREPSFFEKVTEQMLLKKLESEDDGFDRVMRVRQMIREEREDMEGDYDHSSGLTAALERFGPTLLAGLAATLNPQGYQQALFAAQNQAAAAAASAAGQPAPPPPGGSQVAMRGPETVSGAVQAPAAAPELGDDQDADAQNDDVLLFPLRASTVLTNLDTMPPAVFARWILEQPVLGSQMAALAQQSDDEIWKSLEVASANPLAGEFQAVFAWLRQHPQQATAIVEAMRMMTIKLDDQDDVAI